MDPGIAKLVSLPFFSSALPDVLISYKLTSVELFLAFQAWSGEDFVCKFLALAPVLGPTNPADLPCSITLCCAGNRSGRAEYPLVLDRCHEECPS